MESPDLLRNAVQAARSGQRPAARALFLQVVLEDPGCELAWLWLSELNAQPDERILALEKALAIRPNNPAAQARLEQLRAAPDARQPDSQPFTPSHSEPVLGNPFVGKAKLPFSSDDNDPDEPVGVAAGWGLRQPAAEQLDAYHQALRLSKDGKTDAALGLLRQWVEVHEQHADAWLLIANLAAQAPEQIAALQKVLSFQPDNQDARAQLQRLEKLAHDPLRVGAQHEERGEREQAAAIYQWIVVHSRSATDRLEANRRITNLQMLQEADRLQPVDPTLNLLRLTFGPVLLFGLLILIQGGINPLKISLVSLLGEVSVLTGSLLVNATGLRPLHPLWVQQFGRPGTGSEPEMRFSLRLLGWALLIAPYLLFIIEALHRIALFRITLDS